jgi:hypothetical protein
VTVSSTTDRATFLGNGVTDSFPLPFRFFADGDIQAALIDHVTLEVMELVLGVDYTLIGANQPEQNGTPASIINLTVAPPSGVSLFVRRVIPATQPTDIVNQGRFFPEIHENVFDRLTMQIQQSFAIYERTLRVGPFENPIVALPPILLRANRLLSFDSLGRPIAINPPGAQGWLSVESYGAKGDGVADDTNSVADAISAAISSGASLFWPAGTFRTTSSIPGFHSVRHVGSGVIKRGSETFNIYQAGGQLNKLFVSPNGMVGNDGLSASEPMPGIQSAVDALATRSKLEGRWQVIGAGGVYSEAVSIPDGLAQGANYLEFKFPAAPGIRGEPGSWPVGGAVLDGTGLSGTGFNVGQYNKVYIEYLLVRNWFNVALPATSQVVSGVIVGRFSLLFAYGVSAIGNGWQNIYVQPRGAAVITGGVLDGARYVVDNTGGRISFTANASTYTILRNGLEYGIYAKHDGSTVCDFTRFINCGQVPAASEYGAAIFAYKSGTSVDTRQCVFENNNICYHSRSGGHIATDIPSTDVLGSGPTANDRVWKITGFGNNDAINYRSLAGRDLCRQFSGGSTASASIVNISGADSVCTIPAQYFQNADQYLEIEITGVANTGTATVRPTWVSDEPTNYSFGVFTIAPNTRFRIRLLIYPTGASAQFLSFDNVGATSGGATLGTSTASAPFGDRPMTFRVRGEITSGTLVIDRVRVVLWG